MTRRVSAYDVAKVAGVSQSTVSRVLNNYPYVKQETRDKVLEAIQEIGFSPDEIARSLAKNKTNTIGLITTDISNPFYGETAHIILREAQKYDYDVIIIDAETDSHSFERAVSTLVGKRVDGIIVASIRKDNRKILDYGKQGLPIISYNRKIDDHERAHFIEVDNKLGAQIAVDYLVELKHESIAFISGPMIYSTFHDRLQGYQQAIQAHGLTYDESIVYQGENEYDQIVQFSLSLLKKDTHPTAFFASTDNMALAIMDAVAQSGRKIPEDVSIIGFDDINIAGNPYIGLTTVSQHKNEMAVQTLDTLIHLMEDSSKLGTPKQIIFTPALIVRKTTAVNSSSST